MQYIIGRKREWNQIIKLKNNRLYIKALQHTYFTKNPRRQRRT
jgi:hypothetical protein